MAVAPFKTWVWATRRKPAKWVPVWLYPETHIDEGSFVLTGEFHSVDGELCPVSEYRPGRDGTHTPLGELGLAEHGLREDIPHPDDKGE